MSTRAMGRLYTGMGGGAGGAGIGQLLGSLLGYGQISGGPQVGPNQINPETDEEVPNSRDVQYQPFQAKSGFFNRGAQTLAAQLNAMLGGQMLEQQGKSKLSAQESKQREHEMTMANELATQLINSKQFADMMTTYGIPVGHAQQMIPQIAQEVASNLYKSKRNVGKALDDPDVQRATKENEIASLQANDAKNRALLTQNVPMGGTSHQPGPLQTGMGTTVTGATPGGQELHQIYMGKDKQGNPMYSPTPAITTVPTRPGGVSVPIPGQLWNSIGNNAMPGVDTSNEISPYNGLDTGIQNPPPGAAHTQNPLEPAPQVRQGQQPALGTGMAPLIAKALMQNAGQNNPFDIGGMLPDRNNVMNMYKGAGSNIMQLLRILSNINNPDQLQTNAAQ